MYDPEARAAKRRELGVRWLYKGTKLGYYVYRVKFAQDLSRWSLHTAIRRLTKLRPDL